MFEQGMIIQNRYEIIEEVGSGGMSIVYKAKCHVLNRYVAIKVLKLEFSDDRSFVNKFRIEAQSAAGLSHPNIVNVFDVGEENGFHYIVMELVEGITLKEYIQQNGRLPYATALDFIMQICAGIEVAHSHNTIHRDIKPQNIIVSRNGTLKVTDFGIAKAATSNTIASSAMGSVHYISPEQARGGYSDERSDIYSLGITLYEMLTGRVPFEGENNVTVALMHIQSEIIPPREYYPDIPMGIERIVLKATQKKPERRYLTTNALMADLNRVAVDPNAEVGIIGTMMSSSAPTIQISEEEMAIIKTSSMAQPEGISMFPISHSNEEVTGAHTASGHMHREEEYEELYEDDEEDDEDESLSKDIDPKMEKIITIGAIIATIIIAIIIIVAIASIGSSFKKSIPTTTEVPSTEEKVAPLQMPGVTGLDEEKAFEILNDARIYYDVEREYSSTFEANVVMSQSIPEGEEIEEGARVKLIISKGKDEIDVPDVVGKTAEEAKQTLTNAGFSVVEDEDYDEDVEKGYVISQSPDGDGKAEKGSEVTIVVSKGEEVKVAEVPNLKKKTVTEAEQMLSEVNLKLGKVNQEYHDSIPEGQVISQSLEAGLEVKEGTEVGITISKGKKPTTKTYTASFSGMITNSSYEFREAEQVYVTLILKVGDASYTLIENYYTEGSFPIDLSELSNIEGLASKEATLVYKVEDENGNDITGSFASTGQAKLKAVEQ